MKRSMDISSSKKYVNETYLRSPSTSGRSFVIAMTSANNVTKVVMKATGELQVEIKISKI
jgi:GDP-D-mannose dehydratase